MNIFPSQFAKAVLNLKGKPLDLTEYKPFEIVYDVAPQYLTAMCGRQIGKSVSLASGIIANSILRPYFSTLFISPLSQQTSRFSSQYLEPFINSRIIRSHFLNSESKKNVFLRTFNNGSAITLGYAETESDADRIRGVAADCMFYDEVQDASHEALPVLEETLSASEYSFRRYTGTAKGEANTLTLLYKKSNMMEWVVKCTHCGKYNIPNEFERCMKIMTGNKNGPACMHCGGLIDVKTGVWLAGRPSVKDHIGVHIPQFCIPARTVTKPGPNGKVPWFELVTKASKYDKVKLSNEVFGLAVGAGGRPLSLNQVMAVCNSERKEFDTGFPMDGRNILRTVIGVDWSVTGSTQSYTVITVLGFDSAGKAYILYVQKLEGIDILEQVARIIQLFHQYKCSYIGSDRGVGVVQGQMLQTALGPERVGIMQYVTAKTNLRYDRQGGFFAADRTPAIDTSVIKVKMGMTRLECPCWEVMDPFWQDALHIFEEETIAGRRVYRKDPDSPDDFIHSLTFALLADMVVKGEFVYQDEAAVDNGVFSF